MSALLYIASGAVGMLAWAFWPHRSERFFRREGVVVSCAFAAVAVALLCLAGYFWEQGA